MPKLPPPAGFGLLSAGCILLLALTTVILALGCGAKDSPQGMDRQGEERLAKIVAHRGANQFAPENTLPGIEQAIRMGLDYVEMDVRTTRDGKLVLMHNETVDHTTNGTGRVRDLTSEQIRLLDAGSWFAPEFSGTRVPFLEEALQTMRGRIGAYLDVKDAAPGDLLLALEENDMIRSSVIYADPLSHLAMRDRNPAAPVMPEVGDNDLLFNLMLTLFQPEAVAVSWGDPGPEFVGKVHSHGIRIFMDVLGERDNPQGMRAALDLGVDALQTDHPDILLEVMKD
jgi:glycerophosphoryl diester phosphodiesterase